MDHYLSLMVTWLDIPHYIITSLVLVTVSTTPWCMWKRRCSNCKDDSKANQNLEELSSTETFISCKSSTKFLITNSHMLLPWHNGALIHVYMLSFTCILLLVALYHNVVSQITHCCNNNSFIVTSMYTVYWPMASWIILSCFYPKI